MKLQANSMSKLEFYNLYYKRPQFFDGKGRHEDIIEAERVAIMDTFGFAAAYQGYLVHEATNAIRDFITQKFSRK